MVTLLNIHRPRDRSHFERFEAYHTSFYRDVEATSVTPFSPRAVDRGLPAVAVALARLGFADLTPPLEAVTMVSARSRVGRIADIIAKRAEGHAQLPAAERDALVQKLRGRVVDLLDAWAKVAMEKQSVGAGLQYQREVGSAPPLLFDPLDPELKKQGSDARKFKAQRSLRDVEPSVNLIIRRASNAYFTQLVSAISIPDGGEKLRKVVEEAWEFLEIIEWRNEFLDRALVVPTLGPVQLDFLETQLAGDMGALLFV